MYYIIQLLKKTIYSCNLLFLQCITPKTDPYFISIHKTTTSMYCDSFIEIIKNPVKMDNILWSINWANLVNPLA